MAKTKEQKETILKRLEDALKNASSSVFVHFNGVSVSSEGEIRGKLREDGISYFVAKKTLIKRAFEKAGISGNAPVLDGEIAVVYSAAGDDSDPTAPARGVYEFTKKFGEERLSIVGGIFEKSFKDKVAMNEIATIPPIPVLRGMFVNVINSPIQGLVIALSAVADKKQ
jgi:large subunit ribosomal protein L10